MFSFSNLCLWAIFSFDYVYFRLSIFYLSICMSICLHIYCVFTVGCSHFVHQLIRHFIHTTLYSFTLYLPQITNNQRSNHLYTSTISPSHQVRLRGEPGGAEDAGIAVDDVRITAGACPWLRQCQFQDSTCLWEVAAQEESFRWTLATGQDGSHGPDKDHTFNEDSGRNSYVECFFFHHEFIIYLFSLVF